MRFPINPAAILMLFLGFGLVGCATTPCKIISTKWTCNLEVVEPLQPGDFVYVQNGQLQRLAGGAAGFQTTTRPTSIETETTNSNWDFKLSASLELPTKVLTAATSQPTTNPSVTLEDAGATHYSLTFSNTFVGFLTPVANTDPIKDYQNALHLGQQYLDAITPVQRDSLGHIVGQAQDGKVYLITETLNSAVNYTFTGSGNFNTNGGAAVKSVSGSLNGSVANADTKTIQFSNPLSIGYHALLLAVNPSPLQAATQVTVKNTDGYVSPAVH